MFTLFSKSDKYHFTDDKYGFNTFNQSLSVFFTDQPIPVVENVPGSPAEITQSEHTKRRQLVVTKLGRKRANKEYPAITFHLPDHLLKDSTEEPKDPKGPHP
jgi:hypothetical protein